jgi:hypothetical protein
MYIAHAHKQTIHRETLGLAARGRGTGTGTGRGMDKWTVDGWWQMTDDQCTDSRHTIHSVNFICLETVNIVPSAAHNVPTFQSISQCLQFTLYITVGWGWWWVLVLMVHPSIIFAIANCHAEKGVSLVYISAIKYFCVSVRNSSWNESNDPILVLEIDSSFFNFFVIF